MHNRLEWSSITFSRRESARIQPLAVWWAPQLTTPLNSCFSGSMWTTPCVVWDTASWEQAWGPLFHGLKQNKGVHMNPEQKNISTKKAKSSARIVRALYLSVRNCLRLKSIRVHLRLPSPTLTVHIALVVWARHVCTPLFWSHYLCTHAFSPQLYCTLPG